MKLPEYTDTAKRMIESYNSSKIAELEERIVD